ncbi:MxaK protein [Azohydromonas sediminis]|uniref:MxaK protein n=1 Tax=Azohydromonas sediminis TaxID=2259674 RepID=UPI000E648B6B|nr:MxaK protein [Azohydromonas sediminis]
MGLKGGFATRRRTRLVIGALVVLALAALVDGWLLQRAARWNALAAAVGTTPPPADAPPAVWFAHARALDAAGDQDGALQQYRRLQADAQVGLAARYNGANVLIRQALVVRASERPALAIPLIELAKETYRDVLRADPEHWEARYNLERAQRLLPDPQHADDEAGPPPRNAERAATTARGVAQGMP